LTDLFGNDNHPKPIHINIYADEIQSKKCPYSNDNWIYIGLVVEDLNNPLLDDIIKVRYYGDLDQSSPYFEKNNKTLHWSKMKSADEKNICKRWFEYILSPSKSKKIFYSYILGLNESKLVREEFNLDDEFNSKYNRFFRSALLYVIKTFFSNKEIIIENIFHEEGQQQNNVFFPWHCIYKIQNEENISSNCSEITFLQKDHKRDERSNIIQLCDCILGVSTSIIHGIEKSNTSKYREELADLYLPLFQRIIKEPKNVNSSYQYYNRIMIRFFPREKTFLGDYRRLINQFYSNRALYFAEQKSGQTALVFQS